MKNSFAQNLINQLEKSLRQNFGEIVLNSVLTEIHKHIGGVFVPRAASQIVTLKGSALPEVQNSNQRSEAIEFKALCSELQMVRETVISIKKEVQLEQIKVFNNQDFEKLKGSEQDEISLRSTRSSSVESAFENSYQ